MARELWLLRHGDAEPGDGVPDEDRRLTQRGGGQARAAGRGLARLGAQFSLVLTSPRVRAADTGQLAGEALGAEPAEHRPVSGGFDRDEALAVLEGQADEARVLLVGHEPDFSQVVHDLTGARVDLKKGGVAGLKVEGPEGELLVLLRPHDLEQLAEPEGGGD